MRRPEVALALLLVGPLAGCPADDDDDTSAGDVDCRDAHDVPLEVALGLGSPEGPRFEPFPADGAADLHPGPQGGYHVYLQVKAVGLCPNRVEYTRVLREPGEEDVLRQQAEKIPMVDGGDGAWVLPRAQPTFVCPSNTPGVAVFDRDLDLELTLAEDLKAADAAVLPDGPRSLTQHVTLHPLCSPFDTVCSESTDIGCAAP